MSVDGPVVCTNTDLASLQDGFGGLTLNTSHANRLDCPIVAKTLNNIKDINILLSMKQDDDKDKARGKKGRFQLLLADETIQKLEIQIRKREFYFTKQCLVFGDRRILDQEDLNTCPIPDRQYLHVMTKLSDIKKLEVTTDKQRSVMRGLSPINRLIPGSTGSVQDNRLVLRGSVIRQGEDLTTSEIDCSGSEGDPIVHLIIRKSTNVHCYHLKDEGFEIKVSSGTTVQEVKRKIEELTDGFQAHEHKVVKEGLTLHPDMSLSELGVKTGDVLELVQVPLCLEEYPDSGSPFSESPKKDMSFEWEKAKDALAQGVRPKLSSVGTGGSYFISAVEGMNLAVFKPEDEEPLARNNPKGHRGSMDGNGLRAGVRPGEGAVREVIAFLLDHEHFSGVPPTTMVSLSDMMKGATAHRKVGSFQQFVQHDMDCEEMGPSKFPVHEVHKICVLDIRLANADRNGGNILARQEQGQWFLTPIDHGYCLPDSFKDINFEWMYWPQAKVPFDKETSDYINRLDAQKDLEILAKNGLCLRPECARVFLVCTMLLKKALVLGLTPHQIAMIMSREAFNMSPLEKLHKQAMQLTLSKAYGKTYSPGKEQYLEVKDAVYLETMESLLDQYLEEIQSV